MSKMKSKILKICIVIGGILIIIAILNFKKIYTYIYLYDNNANYYIKDFDDYKTEFEGVVNEVSKIKNDTTYLYDNNVDPLILIIVYSADYKISFRDNESNIVNISDDFSNSIKHLSKAFNIHTELNRIMVYDNSVTFCTYGNDYAISYSTDNITPKYMSSSKDSFQIKTKKICDNWYHIIRIYNKF